MIEEKNMTGSTLVCSYELDIAYSTTEVLLPKRFDAHCFSDWLPVRPSILLCNWKLILAQDGVKGHVRREEIGDTIS